MSGETLSQSEIDFYIDGVRGSSIYRTVCTHLEWFMLAAHLHLVRPVCMCVCPTQVEQCTVHMSMLCVRIILMMLHICLLMLPMFVY